jgi:tetratricopeptide (TPR) repeat protein
MAKGEFALVREYLSLALSKTASWVGEHDLYAMLADAAAQQQDASALREFVPRAEEFAARYEHKLYLAIAHRARGVAHRLAGESADAEARLEQALAIFEQLETGWQMGRTLLELGELSLLGGQPAAARERFSRALSAFREIGALPDATRTSDKLAAL